MAITTDDFNKIWASTSPLTPYSFSASQYKEGWNFIGSTPPARQMWDFLQKNNDEKMQYLLNHFDNYLPLSGGTLTGVVNGVTPPNGDNSKKLATTEFIQAELQDYLPLSGGTLTGVVNGVTPPNGDNSKKLANTEFIQAELQDYLPLSGGNITGDLSVTGTITGNVTGNVTGNADTATNATNDANGNPIAGTYLPAVVGAVVAFAGKLLPTGWLLCDGSAVSRTDYAALYAVIGTTYGTGDGSTTFNLPNLVNRMVVGSGSSYAIAATGGETSVTLNVSNIPSHGHMVRTWNNVSSGYPLVYRNGNWERWEEGCFQVSGKWQDNGGNTATAPHNGQGDPAGTTDGTGGNQPHNNMPPYLALRYIIKY